MVGFMYIAVRSQHYTRVLVPPTRNLNSPLHISLSRSRTVGMPSLLDPVSSRSRLIGILFLPDPVAAAFCEHS